MSATPEGFVQTVTGPVAAADLGLTLPHEHLFNDLSGVLDPPSYEYSRVLTASPVCASVAWALRQDPYCCPDNIADKPVDAVATELESFAALGGRTIVDATSSDAIGRNPARLLAVAERTGLNVIATCGAYLEKFEGERITARSVDAQAAALVAELTDGIGIGSAGGRPDGSESIGTGGEPRSVRPGVIGEIGVSPSFTPGEAASVRAAALAQLHHPNVALQVHLPGWQRRAHEVLDIVIGEVGVRPEKVVLCHMDPSACDPDYQRSVADRGVWLEFDMVGMDITYPKEGVSPDPHTTAGAIARLVGAGHAGQLLLSHDVFLKQMWVQHGGNGFAYVPTVFTEILVGAGVDRAVVHAITHDNPAAMLTR